MGVGRGWVQHDSPVSVVSRTTGVTSTQVTTVASPIKLFWKALPGTWYRSRRETSGAHLG